MSTVIIHGQAIAKLIDHPRVVLAMQRRAGAVVKEAQKLARREAYDSGAYHDSMHTEPDSGVAPNGKVYAVAGGSVRPRFAPKAGVMRGPDVDYAAFIEKPTARTPGLHIMRRAAERAAKSKITVMA